MAEAMARLAKQSTLRQEYSKNGRVRARELFDIHRQSKKLLEIYNF
jgi:glycosyltransferase involved in cell wall biosynthesis